MPATNDLRTTIEALRTAAPELNRLADEAATLIQIIETFLSDELHIGIAAMSSDFGCIEKVEDGLRIRVIPSLAYGRVNGQYRIHIREETIALDDDENRDYAIKTERTLWSSHPREVRLASFEKLPELIEKIVNRAIAMDASARAATVTARELMDAMQISPAPHAASDVNDTGIGDYRPKHGQFKVV